MKIVVVGLGYVGLPLAIKFAKHFLVMGYDISSKRVDELKNGLDRNGDVTQKEFAKVANNITFSTDPKVISEGAMVVVAVPTPLKENNDPDLSYVAAASATVAKHMKKSALIVYESTVYPGCTTEFCLPILEKESNMKLGDFYIGFSPERMNPGDPEHSVDKIVKLIAASHPSALDVMDEVYSKITKTHRMSSIMAAESAKIIENVQRDINMALFNELSMLFDKLGLDSKEVFDGAATKWNFIRFKPGLVGGYCIPVNPHYLAYKAAQIDFHPELILAGRKKNESMPIFIAKKAKQLTKGSSILILGASYKENVAEYHSSRVKHLVAALHQEGFQKISLYDPVISATEIFGLKNQKPSGKFDLLIYAVDHKSFSSLKLASLLNPNASILDIPRKLNRPILEKSGFTYWAP